MKEMGDEGVKKRAEREDGRRANEERRRRVKREKWARRKGIEWREEDSVKEKGEREGGEVKVGEEQKSRPLSTVEGEGVAK